MMSAVAHAPHPPGTSRWEALENLGVWSCIAIDAALHGGAAKFPEYAAGAQVVARSRRELIRLAELIENSGT